MDKIREKLEKESPVPSILEEERDTFKYYISTLRDEEEKWRLNSRSLWLQAGDRNTKFFHRQFKARVWRNCVS
jgi:hypothetical protein